MVETVHRFLFTLSLLFTSSYFALAQTSRVDLFKEKPALGPVLYKYSNNTDSFSVKDNTPNQTDNNVDLLAFGKQLTGDVKNELNCQTKPSAFNSSISMESKSYADDKVKANKTILPAPVFPDLQVTANKYEVAEKEVVLTESPASKLERLERIPLDNKETVTDFYRNQDIITISNIKRQYLEGIIKDLEKEIHRATKSSKEIKEKVIELDALNRLLYH